MECCQCQGIESKFDQAYVAKQLEQYQKEGPKKTALQLIEALQAEDIHGLTLLDIGGGVGDLQHGLLKSGVSNVINAEASSAYLEACKEEAERQGHAHDIRHLEGNFVDIAEEVPSADIVTLARVICCYHDMPQLVSLSVQKATQFYGVVYPRDIWLIKLFVQIYYNLRHRLQGDPMRIFVHSTEEVESILRENGFMRHFHREMGVWQVVVFKRQ